MRDTALSADVSGPSATIEHAVRRATDHLLSLQRADGCFWAELESNVTITAEHVFLRHILGRSDSRELAAAAAYLLEQQRPDGTWGNWYESPPELSTTIEAYLALKLAGVSPETPEMAAARQYVLSQGGVDSARVFTKIWLAMMGEWDWQAVPMVPPEFVLLPHWFPVSIYSFACWARQTIVPLSIVLAARPVAPLPEAARIDELFVRGRAAGNSAVPPSRGGVRARAFLLLDRALRLHEGLPVKPLRRLALRRAEQWILERQEADGSWGGIQPPWVYSLIALHIRGHRPETSEPLRRGLAGFYGDTGFAVQGNETFHLQSCLSPVWDTALAVVALDETGLPTAAPSIARARRWLTGRQVFEGGDWQVRCGARPGGFPFEFANSNYPDIDDTAIVLLALYGSDAPGTTRAIERGIEWMIGMQSRCGGWAAFDRNNTQRWTRHIPFCDFGEVIDPPSSDVTAHVLECLGRVGRRIGDPIVDRGLRFLLREQEHDGAWFGRWGVNLTYGLGAALPGLRAVGVTPDHPAVVRGVEWLVRHQNADGGWGERVEGYTEPQWRGRGPSTASQTAWALMGLLAAGRAGHEATRRGVDYLLCTQTASGGWEEPQFTGTGFPTDFMIRYHIYRDVFPLIALARFSKALSGEER